MIRYFIPELRKVWQQHQIATDLIAPIVKEREQQEKLPGYKKPIDSIEWVRDSLPASKKHDYSVYGIVQLTFGAVSVHTTTQAATHTIYDLAARPHYIPILREEARQALKEAGGEWTVESLNSLKKLDSFIKEGQRFGGAAIGWFSLHLPPHSYSPDCGE